ncbi:MAG: hypothetical protein K6E20_03635 [Acholeplasmatales bacterium]|nr:hypothetical protein [Acholeplasmatales bacterium]
MNDVKKKLKEAAAKQEIHDLKDSILQSVDTSKVIMAQPKPIRRTLFVSNVLVTAGIATACILLGVGIGFLAFDNNSNGKEAKPTEPFPVVIDESSFSEMSSGDSASEANALFDEMIIKLDFAFSQDTYNMVSIAHSFKNISYDEVVLPGEDKHMTVSEETALVNDLNSYIYNLEDMLGICAKTSCTKSTNTNVTYDYEEIMKVVSPYYNYDVYVTETPIEEKNIGETNYKLKSNIEGIIVYDTFSYSYLGNKRFENDKTTFNMSIKLDENTSVDVEEIYKLDLHEYRYTYKDNESNILKKIIIKEVIDKETNALKKIEYNNGYTGLTIESDEQKEGSIYCELKGRDNETLTMTKLDDGTYNYQFKNSGNIYTK